MMRLVLVAAAIGTTTLACASADAFWLDDCYCRMKRGYKVNQMWPRQFIEADRRNAAAPFETMVRNGWRRQNLLGSHHFNEDGTKLTDSGKLKVKWILTQTPAPHRQVYIEQSLDSVINEARLASTNEFAKVVVGHDAPTGATTSHILSDGRPATMVDFVNTQYRENMATPALPTNSYTLGNE